MSKIAVASVEGGLDSQVSPVFGRCQFFTIVEKEKDEINQAKVLDNPHDSAPQGAGTQAAGMIAREGVEAIVAGSFGPKVFPVFDQTNLGAFTAGQVSVEEAAQKYFADDLPVASGGAGDTSPEAAQPPAGGQRPGGGGGGAGGAGGGQGGRGRGGRGRGGGGGR